MPTSNLIRDAASLTENHLNYHVLECTMCVFFLSSNVLSPTIFHKKSQSWLLSLGEHHSFLAWTKNPMSTNEGL